MVKKRYLKTGGIVNPPFIGKKYQPKKGTEERLQLWRPKTEILPGCAPKVYLYDETMDCMFMEDLKDYTVLRRALIEEDRIFPIFAEQISSFWRKPGLGHRMSVRIIFKKYQVKDLPIRNCVR